MTVCQLSAAASGACPRAFILGRVDLLHIKYARVPGSQVIVMVLDLNVVIGVFVKVAKRIGVVANTNLPEGQLPSCGNLTLML